MAKRPPAPEKPSPPPKPVNVARLHLQVGPVAPKPGSMLIEKRRRGPK